MKHTIQEVEAAYGVKGLIIYAPGAPVVSYGIQFRSGLGAMHAWPFQTAHVLEHVVRTGPDIAAFSKKADFIQELNKNGGYSNALTDASGISYVGSCIPDEVSRVISLQKSAVENPRITEKLTEAEKGNVTEELRQYVANNTRLAWELSMKALTGGYWLTAQESIDETKLVTYEAISNYYKLTHNLENTRFIVVGDIQADSPIIESLLNDFKLPKGERMSGSELALTEADAYLYEERPSLSNVFTNFSFALPRRLSDDERAAVKLLNYVLCNPWNSRILGKAREAGIGYSMNGELYEIGDVSIWMLQTPIGTDNVPAFFKLIANALKDVNDKGLDQDELKRAKQFTIGRYKQEGQTTKELYDMYAQDYFDIGRIYNDSNRINALEIMTNEQIKVMLNEFLGSSYRTLSGVGSLSEAQFSKEYSEFKTVLNS